MALGGLISRIGRGAGQVGRGLQRAAPTVQRLTAGGAAAFGNRRPLEDLRAQDEIAKRDALTQLGLDRQARQDTLAEQQDARSAQQFETSQGLAGLQRRELERQAKLAPQSPEEEFQRSIQQEKERATALAPFEQEKMIRDAQGKGYTPEYTPRFGQLPSNSPDAAKLGLQETTPLPGWSASARLKLPAASRSRLASINASPR